MAQTAELENTENICDLGKQHERLQNFHNRLKILQRDIQQERDRHEYNLRELAGGRDRKIKQLCEQYYSYLEKGDKENADACLGKIRAERQGLEKLCREIMTTDSNDSELAERAEKLRLEAQGLHKTALRNFKMAEKDMKFSSGLMSLSGEGLSRDLNKLQENLKNSQKTANSILSE